MARQKGIFPIQGTIGNVTFFKSKDGYLAREKGGVDANKIATAPEFQRTRENNAEFGRAGKAGKLLRDAFRALILKCSSNGIVSRIVAVMMMAIKLDATSQRGQRNVLDGELGIFQGFEFNEGAKLSAVFYPNYTSKIDRVSGAMTVTIPPFVPGDMLAAPAGATHFKLSIGGAELDFTNNTSSLVTDGSQPLAITPQATTAISLSANVGAGSTQPLFLAFAVEFLQEVNSNFYPLKNGAYNAMAFIKVEGI